MSMIVICISKSSIKKKKPQFSFVVKGLYRVYNLLNILETGIWFFLFKPPSVISKLRNKENAGTARHSNEEQVVEYS